MTNTPQLTEAQREQTLDFFTTLLGLLELGSFSGSMAEEVSECKRRCMLNIQLLQPKESNASDD